MGILHRITQRETFQKGQIIGLNVTRLLSGNEKHTHFLIVILKLRIKVRDRFFKGSKDHFFDIQVVGHAATLNIHSVPEEIQNRKRQEAGGK